MVPLQLPQSSSLMSILWRWRHFLTQMKNFGEGKEKDWGKKEKNKPQMIVHNLESQKDEIERSKFSTPQASRGRLPKF